MGTTDQRLKAALERGTDDTDEEQRQISDGVFICHSAEGRIQSNLHPIFYQWNQCDPWSARLFLLIEAKRSEAALGYRGRSADSGRRWGTETADRPLSASVLEAKNPVAMVVRGANSRFFPERVTLRRSRRWRRTLSS